MGIKSTDLYIQEAFIAALDDLRKNEYLLKDMMSDVVEDELLNEKYGQEELNKLKLFLGKEITIGQAYRLDNASIPGVGIEISGGSEVVNKTGDQLSDGYEAEYQAVEYFDGAISDNANSYFNLNALEFEPSTGKIVINKIIPLFEGMLVVDEKSHKTYPIILVTDENTCYIEAGNVLDLNNFTIRPPEKRYKNIRKNMIFQESVKLTLATTNFAELIYLYNITMYILGRYKADLFETKNFRVSTIQYGPIYHLTEDPNIVFARDINISGQVTHSFIAYTQKNLLGSRSKLKIDKMTKTPSSYIPDAKKQGWESPED
jgi:hypothetical protein